MRFRPLLLPQLLLPAVFLLLQQQHCHVNGTVVINEVADSGSSNACDGRDWVELYNAGNFSVNLGDGFKLHDDKGINNEEAFRFPQNTVLDGFSYLLLCTRSNNASALSPLFGIGSTDTISLVRQDNNLVEIYSTVPLPGPENRVEDMTYALDPDTGMYNYTSTPTPGAENVMTRIPTQAELMEAIKARLALQNEQGMTFFNFDSHGDPVENGMDTILELKITMAAEEFSLLQDNPQYETYRPFETASVMTQSNGGGGGEELLTLTSPGRIRTRGIDAVYMAACLDTPLPFRLDFDRSDLNGANETQTLFGASRVWLRHSVHDASHMREWAYHRMLARFGLPHARTRMVNFYINDQFMGFYTLMEAPDQDYVFARNFPEFDPSNYALFQTTFLTQQCGQYPQSVLEAADRRINEETTPPYAFERGEHNPSFDFGESLPYTMDTCRAGFQRFWDESLTPDVAVAYLRHEEDCAELFLREGLVDQELGTDNWDNEIENFIAEVMSFKRCDTNCANSMLASEVDVKNFLKTFAFYAVTLSIASPMGNINNHYLAQTESDEEKWKLFAYDFSYPGPAYCQEEICSQRFIHWSIARPTCESLEANSLVGPLLTNDELHSQYLEYVRTFLDTIYANETVVAEIQAHAEAIQEAVTVDGSSYDNELSPDAAEWNTEDGRFSLLPTMKARAADVRMQLAAIDDGSFARGPHVGMKDNEAWEPCADWRMEEPDTSACEEGCNYDNCFMEGWTIESYCDAATGTCYHGDLDLACLGIADGDAYSSMEQRGSKDTYCRVAGGLSVKASVCPRVGESVDDASSSSDAGGESSDGSRSPIMNYRQSFLLQVFTVAIACAPLFGFFQT